MSNDELFKMKEFREAIVEKLDEIFGKIEVALESLQSGPDEDKKFKTIMTSTATLMNVLQYSERLEKYFLNVNKKLEQMYIKIKDAKLLSAYKPYLKSIASRLAEEEYEIKWTVITRL